MKGFASQEIKEFVSRPLFDEKVILNKDPSWPKISIVTPLPVKESDMYCPQKDGM